MRRTAKTKRSRRIGELIMGSATAFAKKKYPPGAHGFRSQNLSEYGRQVTEKQKARFLYGLTERQMRNSYLKAAKSKEPTGIELMTDLELRLDNVLFRAGLTKSRLQARQMINHKLVSVNKETVNIPSYKVNLREIIQMNEKGKKVIKKQIKSKGKKGNVVSWIKIDPKDGIIEIISMPTESDFEQIIDPRLIIEYYSK